MGYYRDLRDHLKALEEKGKLVRIKETINKDTELMPLVRWQFRGLPEEDRKAFIFERVTGVTGREYSIPVVVGSLAASRDIYAIGMMCRPEDILERWTQAQLHPIEPRLVSSGPAQEVVHMGNALTQEGGGLEMFPIPISTPGFDNGPYTTVSDFVTKDPDTCIINVGRYRSQVKARARSGVNFGSAQHIGHHWKKCRDKGIPLEAALIIGNTPCIDYVSVSKIPYGLSEYAVAGGIAGEAIELVKCKTVNLEVPATAEIVIEGRINTEFMEPEGPFGEHTGYMDERELNPYFEITCITHRRDPIFATMISQFPPSESSKVKQIAFEANWYKFLKYDCNMPGVLEVAMHESGSSRHYCVIKLKKTNPADSWQALYASSGLSPIVGKYIIAVDEDIDPRDPDAVNWALSFRTQPHLDCLIIKGKSGSSDIAVFPPGSDPLERKSGYPKPLGTSAILIDATRKADYTPVCLPAREFMERAREIWERLNLPKLKVRDPWYGYPLGHWTEQDQEEAELALEGQHYVTGEKYARQRVKALKE